MIDEKINDFSTSWDGYKGHRVQEFIKDQFLDLIDKHETSVSDLSQRITDSNLRINELGLIVFDGLYSLRELQLSENEPLRNQVVNKHIYITELAHFVCIRYWDGITPKYADDLDWNGDLYNTETNGIKHPKDNVIFKYNCHLYRGGYDSNTGDGYLTISSVDILDVKKTVTNMTKTEKDKLSSLGILPFDGVWPSSGPNPSRGVYFSPKDETNPAYFIIISSEYGYDSNDYNQISYDINKKIARTDRIYRNQSNLYRVTIEGKLEEIKDMSSSEHDISDLTNNVNTIQNNLSNKIVSFYSGDKRVARISLYTPGNSSLDKKAFIGLSDISNLDDESKTALYWFQQNIPNVEYVSLTDLISGNKTLETYKMIWCHFDFDDTPDEIINSKSIIKNYYLNGGNLLISREATRFIGTDTWEITKNGMIPNVIERVGSTVSNKPNICILNSKHPIFFGMDLYNDTEEIVTYFLNSGVTYNNKKFLFLNQPGLWEDLNGDNILLPLSTERYSEGNISISEIPSRIGEYGINTGKVILIGESSYEWYDPENSYNPYRENIYTITKNSINYLCS